MKQETKETKKPKSFIKKAKKVRSMVMMTLLCVLMMSAATYAWFTLSNTAKASNLTMTVGDVTGLQISLDEATWGGEIDLGDVKAKLMPATYVKDGSEWAFYKPAYDDAGKITGIEKLNGDDGKITDATPDTTKVGYYYEKTFFLKSLGQDADIYLSKGTGLDDDKIKDASSTVAGTYIEIKDSAQAADTNNLAPAAVRISFKVGTNAPVSYAPFNDEIKTGTAAEYIGSYTASTNDSNRPVIVASQNSDGTFNNGIVTSADKSQKLFSLTKDASTPVTMCVWIEGDDPQCVNEIQIENLIGQLVFVSEQSTT